jgi:NAD(P)-dependent dehydrogenase (short-subunit alcohol dehydrogenase family)
VGRIELAGATVLVTGAGRGIGRATAAAFARAGATVCLGDVDTAAARAAAAEIGPNAHGLQLDVASNASFARFLAAAERRAGPPSVLVNNAGVMPLGRFLDESDETSRRTLDVNLWGVVLGMRLVVPGMVERGDGHVVNVASMMGKLHVPGAAVYGATKYAVVGLSAAVRDELAGTGVSVSAVLPGAVRTDLVAGVPLGRVPTVDAEDVAVAIVGSCASRAAEIPVPGWMRLYEPAVALAPGPVVRGVRRLLGHDRVLTKLDPEQRAAYEERVRDQAP